MSQSYKLNKTVNMRVGIRLSSILKNELLVELLVNSISVDVAIVVVDVDVDANAGGVSDEFIEVVDNISLLKLSVQGLVCGVKGY